MKELDDIAHFIKTHPHPNKGNILRKIAEMNALAEPSEALLPKEKGRSYGPSRVEIGDIIRTQIGCAFHPGIVISVGRYVQCVTVSSKGKKAHRLMPVGNSRFLNGYFTPSVVVMTKGDALRRFVAPFENKKTVQKCIKKLKEHYEKTFKNASKQTKKEENSLSNDTLRQAEDTTSV